MTMGTGAGHRVRDTSVVGILALAGLAAVAWFLVLSPRLAAAAEIAAQVEQVDFSTAQMQNRYRQAVDQARTATAAAAQAQALFETMPQEAELPEVLIQVIDAAARAGIDADQISVINTSVPRAIMGDPALATDPQTPAGVAARDLGVALAQLDLDVTATGSRDSLMRFLDNVQGLDRAMLITSTGLVSVNQPGQDGGPDGPASGLQSLDLTGSMFVLQSTLPDLVATVEEILSQAGL
ncbi:MAG: hypothetical protein ACYC0W_09060, partial [Candidatus Nanopelagicales bacterium]